MVNDLLQIIINDLTNNINLNGSSIHINRTYLSVKPKYPAITVSELMHSENLKYTTIYKQARGLDLAIEFMIFCSTVTTIDNETYPAVEACAIIQEKIEKINNDIWQFSRKGSPTIFATNIDKSIIAQATRYYGLYNPEDGTVIKK